MNRNICICSRRYLSESGQLRKQQLVSSVQFFLWYYFLSSGWNKKKKKFWFVPRGLAATRRPGESASWWFRSVGWCCIKALERFLVFKEARRRRGPGRSSGGRAARCGRPWGSRASEPGRSPRRCRWWTAEPCSSWLLWRSAEEDRDKEEACFTPRFLVLDIWTDGCRLEFTGRHQSRSIWNGRRVPWIWNKQKQKKLNLKINFELFFFSVSISFLF